MSTLTVTQLNKYLKSVIEDDFRLKNVYIVGEISNCKYHIKSGHIYLTLKDEQTQLKAIIFSSLVSKLKFEPVDGMRVICRGRVVVYERDGTYQLRIEDIQPDGVGALNLAFEQLKDKLSKEGLFDTRYKKPIPKYPRKIGVATSNSGAAVEDIKNITKRRYPIAELVIAPTIVQGDLAPADIVKSIKRLDSIDDIDVIIVGRGGGSIEDLWAFNTEEVARAVFACNKPVISAVGHETDFTICDFVADLRAETPSAAAENAVPDINVLLTYVENSRSRLSMLLQNRLDYEMQRLDSIQNDSILGNINEYFENHYDIVENYNCELIDAFSNIINNDKHTVSNIAGRLNALSPLSVLARGYSAVTDDNDSIIKSVHQIKTGSNIKLRFSDGNAVCTVKEVNSNGNDI